MRFNFGIWCFRLLMTLFNCVNTSWFPSCLTFLSLSQGSDHQCPNSCALHTAGRRITASSRTANAKALWSVMKGRRIWMIVKSTSGCRRISTESSRGISVREHVAHIQHTHTHAGTKWWIRACKVAARLMMVDWTAVRAALSSPNRWTVRFVRVRTKLALDDLFFLIIIVNNPPVRED